MSEHLPDSFDPDPLPDDHPPQAATTEEPHDGDGREHAGDAP